MKEIREDFDKYIEEIGLTQEDLEEIEQTLAPPIPKNIFDKYTLEVSDIHGTGIRTTEDVSDGDDIGLFKIGEYWTEAGRFINHSPYPNAAVSVNDCKATVVAMCTITKGTEVTVNYRQVKEAMKRFAPAYIVVDDFCEHLEYVKKSAHAAGFDTWNPNKGEIGSSVYEGMGLWGDHAVMLRALVLATGTMLVPNCMFFRATNRGMEKAYIHSDRETGNHSCVVYMSKHDEPSGTAFFRHKETGLLEMPSFVDMDKAGILEDLKKDIVERAPDKWEQLAFVEGKYNRALIFHAPLFHSRFPLEGIGTTADDGRLVWVSHFYKLGGDGELK